MSIVTRYRAPSTEHPITRDNEHPSTRSAWDSFSISIYRIAQIAIDRPNNSN